ncbi:hypothetical protein PFISCL1PPCAC_2352, partial [Pristionchus fissidentatus]
IRSMPVANDKVVPENQESDDNESSDIAESTEVSEDDEENSSEGSSSDEEDDDDESAERLSSGSSAATEYDSSNVWSEEEDEVEAETKEATEAAIMNDFKRSLDLILNKKEEKAKKILLKILKHPSVAKHKTTEFLWENNVTDNSHLNKMGQVFVGAHKNLAMIDAENAIEHQLQVVGIAPQNDEVWFDLGQRLVQKGDLDMAIYAFEQTGDWRAEESLMSTHFLRRNYKTALQFVAVREERAGSFAKGEFLKKKIASMSAELNEHVKQVFGQTSFQVDPIYEKEASARLSSLQSKIADCLTNSLTEEVAEERMEPIKISLSADQTAWDIMIVFCDLFDRIQAYSEMFSQRIFIEEWECREDRLIVEDAVEAMVDDVVTVENTVSRMVDLTSVQVPSTSTFHPPMGRGRPPKMGTVKSRRLHKEEEGGVRVEESSCDEEERPTSVDSVALREPSGLEDVQTYYLDSRPVRPLREGPSQAPSRMSVTPTASGSEEELLTLIRETLYEERYLTVVNALEICLYCVVTLDCLPSRSSHNSEILMQVYRRWTQSSAHLLESHQLSIHAFMLLYDEPVAMDYCIRVVHSSYEQTDEKKVMKFPLKRDLIRFIWKKVERGVGNGEETIEWLRKLEKMMEEEEAVNVVGGVVSCDSIREILEKKERAIRIRSLKHFSGSKKWEEIVSTVESDSQWSSVDDDDELSVRTRLYSKALINLGKEEKAVEIINRMLFQLLSQPSLPATTITPWIKLLNTIKYSTIPADSKILPSLGYSLLRLSEHAHLARDWKLWRLMHRVIKRIEESRPDLLTELDKNSKEGEIYNRSDVYDEMPLRSLRFLVNAHDKLATREVCGQENGAFLAYSMAEFRLVMEKEEVREKLQKKELGWLARNVQLEIYQCLHCTFGKYSKKKRSAEDHETGLEKGEERAGLMECAIALSIPNPIPEFDDKGAGGGVDLIDLVNNRFPSFVKLNERRQRRVDELKKWIERGPVWKGELKEGETIEEKKRSLLRNWPHSGIDTKLESVVFYLLALHYHRQSKQQEARQFSEYFLSSSHVLSFGEEITKGALVILSYATIERMFKMYDDDLLLEMEQHVRPLRVAMEMSTKSDATVPFLLAHSLYQASSRFSRFFRRLSVSDTRFSHLHLTIVRLREESAALFENVLETAPAMQQAHQSAWDYQWLSYFFLAKLNLKSDTPDVVKAVDGLFESACALQMGGAVYQPRIAVKNQKNLEPVEIHYQVHAVIWKYITRTANPSLSVLVSLRSYIDAFTRHGVVKPSNNPNAIIPNLFDMEPVISETTLNLSLRCGRSEDETDEEHVVHNIVDKLELIEEMKSMCKKAFEVVADRFPHRKAFYRLAEIAVRDGDYHAAHTFIFKKIFPRKKKEEGLFDNVVEFTSTDIDRSDSLSFHITRSLRLGLAISVKVGDASSIVTICGALAHSISEGEEGFVLKMNYLSMLKMSTRALSIVISSHPRHWATKSVKMEILALYKTLADVRDNIPLVYLRDEVKKLIVRNGGMQRLEMEATPVEKRQTQTRKRKAEDAGAISRQTKERMLMERLGLAGPRPQPKSLPTPILPRPTTSSTVPMPTSTVPMSTTQSILSLINQSMLASSPNRPSTSQSSSSPLRPSTSSLPSTSNSPINNQLLQILLQQAQQNSKKPVNNLFNQFMKK